MLQQYIWFTDWTNDGSIQDPAFDRSLCSILPPPAAGKRYRGTADAGVSGLHFASQSEGLEFVLVPPPAITSINGFRDILRHACRIGALYENGWPLVRIRSATLPNSASLKWMGTLRVTL